MKKLCLLLASSAMAIVVGSVVLKGEVTKVKADGGEVTVINPFADYRFQDAENPGKDTSGNGFDLTTEITSVNEAALQILEDEGGKYLSICRDEYPATGASKGTGAYMYASELGESGKDWSDLISGSYTVSCTIKAANMDWMGDRYAVSVGRYNSAFSLVPWRGGVDVSLVNEDFYTGPEGQSASWIDENRCQVATGDITDKWCNITTVGNVNTGVASIYIDGVWSKDVEVEGGIRFSNTKEGLEASGYAFALGAQCMYNGGANTQYGKCQYRFVSVYDCALSAANVAKVAQGQAATAADQGEDEVFVTGITPIDASTLDLDVTDANTLKGIINNQLSGKKIKVATSDGLNRNYDAFYYPTADGKIKGKAFVPAVNAANIMAELEYQYVAKFDCDEAKVTISDVKLDNRDYVPGTAVDAKRHTISFVLTPVEGVTIEEVDYLDMGWDAEEDEPGLYYITFTKGALIKVITSGTPAGQSSEDSTPVTSTPTSGGTSQGGDTPTGGCGGSIIGASAVLAAVALGGIALAFSKRKQD